MCNEERFNEIRYSTEKFSERVPKMIKDAEKFRNENAVEINRLGSFIISSL